MAAPLFCIPGERLTGYALLNHNKRGSDYASKSEMIRAAGYTRIRKNGEEATAFTEYYEALIEIKEFNARRELITWANNNPSKSPTIRSLIAAIQHQIGYDYRTDCVSRTNANFYRNFEDVDVNIYHQNKLIAAVDYKRKMVVLRISEGSKSDKERLNRILMHFCGLNLFSRNKVWHVSYPLTGHDKAVKGYWTEVPFCASRFD
jgi:hypothetical protein